jgi:hypothetical protein
MRATLQASIRQSVIFWAVSPIIVTLLVVVFIEISGRFFSEQLANSATGIMFIAAFVPLIAAHLSFFSAAAGLILLPFGLTANRGLIVSILLGLIFGVFMLHKIYLS